MQHLSMGMGGGVAAGSGSPCRCVIVQNCNITSPLGHEPGIEHAASMARGMRSYSTGLLVFFRREARWGPSASVRGDGASSTTCERRRWRSERVSMHSLPNRAGGAPSRPCRRCPRLLPGQRRSLPAAHRCGPAESLQNRVGPPHGWSAVGRGLKRRTSNRLVNIARRRQPNVPPLRPERTLPRNLHTSLGQAPFPRGTVLWRFGDSVPRFADLGLGTGLDSTTTHTVRLTCSKKLARKFHLYFLESLGSVDKRTTKDF